MSGHSEEMTMEPFGINRVFIFSEKGKHWITIVHPNSACSVQLVQQIEMIFEPVKLLVANIGIKS